MVISIVSIIAAIIAVIWVRGIDRMQKEYPDYRGEDLFEEEVNKRNK